MKTEDEIKKRLEETEKLLNDEENQNDIMQIKLWDTINILNWILRG